MLKRRRVFPERLQTGVGVEDRLGPVVLVFTQDSSGLWNISEGDQVLDQLEFPANTKDLTRMTRNWTIEYRPQVWSSHGLMLREVAKPHTTPMATILGFLRPKKTFRNKSDLINNLREVVEKSAVSDVAEGLRGFYGR